MMPALPRVNNVAIAALVPGTLELAAATVDQRGRLHNIVVKAEGATTFKFQRGTTDLSGEIDLADNENFRLSAEEATSIQSDPNEALNLVVSAGQLDGFAGVLIN